MNKPDLANNQNIESLIINNLLDGVVIVDVSGKILFANKACEKLFGKKHDQLLGHDFGYTVSPSQLQEIVMYRKGKICYVQLLATAIVWGAQNAFLMSLRDITKTKELQKDLKRTNKASDKKDEFIAIASHELKTPLTCLKAYIDLLKSKLLVKEDEEIKLYVEKTSTFAVRLNNLINDLLDVSHIQSGKIKFNYINFDFGNFIKECAGNLTPISNKHQIILKSSVTTLVCADKERLEQVVTNLVSNAIKYSPGSNKIIIEAATNNKNILVSVRDFGIGISSENINKLFDRFYRVEGVAEKFQGMGLGLFISAEIIKRHGGKFWVESSEGKGSTFIFTLPVTRVMLKKCSDKTRLLSKIAAPVAK